MCVVLGVGETGKRMLRLRQLNISDKGSNPLRPTKLKIITMKKNKQKKFREGDTVTYSTKVKIDGNRSLLKTRNSEVLYSQESTGHLLVEDSNGSLQVIHRDETR